MTVATPCAVIIGVNHYRAFDASLGLMAGTSDLYGPINDTRLYYKIARQRGIAPSNIRVLTSAAVDPKGYADDADPANFKHATAEEIRAALRWIVEQLDVAGRPVGFVAFSGHGDYLTRTGELVLCPQDVAAVYDPAGELPDWRLEPVVRLEDLSGSSDINLTYLLDVCHGSFEYSTSMMDCSPEAVKAWKGYAAKHPGAAPLLLPVHRPDPCWTQAEQEGREAMDTTTSADAAETVGGLRASGTARCLTRRTLPGGAKAAWKTRPDAVLLAADVGTPAYEYPFDGVWHGAFSWALARVLERWAFDAPGEDRSEFRIANREAVERVKAMLQALEFRQAPVFVGKAALQNCRVLNAEDSADVGTGEPQPARKHEIYPDDITHAFRVYNISQKVLGVWTQIGQVLATGSNDVVIPRGGITETYKANRTYWWYTTDPWNTNIFGLKEAESLASANTLASLNKSYKNFAMSTANTVNTTVAVDYDIVISDRTVGAVDKVPDGAKTDLKFYMITTSISGQQPPYFMTGPTVRLEFHSNAGNKSINGWFQYDDQL